MNQVSHIDASARDALPNILLARYHSSGLGRFLSVDPVTTNGARLREPQTLNLYSYTGNNPLTYVDPSGATKIKFFIDTGRIHVDPEQKGRSAYDIQGSSGRGNCLNNPSCSRKRGEGPIPPGEYTADSDDLSDPSSLGDIARNTLGDWGDFRVPLEPRQGTDVKDEDGKDRDGFFLHGGSEEGSAGCIDAGGGVHGSDETDQLKEDIRNDPDGEVEVEVVEKDPESKEAK